MSGANVIGTVAASLDEVWKRFRGYGPSVMEWWPIYEKVEIVKGDQEQAGCVRFLKCKDGHTYRENLELLDDKNHIMVYTMVEAVPSVPTLKEISTRIEMVAKSPKETTIHWTSDVKASSLVLGKIIAFQEETYREAIKSLDRFFNPSQGFVDVEVIKGSAIHKGGLFAPNPYVVVDLDKVGPKKTKARLHTINPVWNEHLKLDVLDLHGELRVSVWSENYLGADEFLGGCAIDVHSLTSGKKTFSTTKLDEAISGEISLALTLNLHEGTHLGLTEGDHKLQEFERMKHVLNQLKDQAMHTLQELSSLEPADYGYSRYPRSPLYPDVDLENLPKMVDQLHMSQVLPPEKMGRVVQRTFEYLYSQVQFLNRCEANKDMHAAIYGGWIKRPEYVYENWKDDAEFCRQLIQGTNPNMITVCSKTTAIPTGLRQLKAQGKTVDQLIDEKRLFILDYEKITGINQYADMYVYAPVALIHREDLGKGQSRLNLVGFQLTRKFDGSDEIFTPNYSMPNRYLFAKMHLASSDNQYHQFIEHLGNAHLAMEPLAIALHNCFPDSHPLGPVLSPHYRETIGINYLARQTLVSPIIPFTDRTFSLGTAGSLWLFLKSYKTWNFEEMSFPNRLAARGFDEKGTDGVQDYFYREDGFLIWNTLLDYYREIVGSIYPDDKSVGQDKAIMKLCKEANDPDLAAIPGFPGKITGREQLAYTLCSITFNMSVQHSAVNFSQYDYISYIPNRPDSLYAWMPEKREELTMEFIEKALPDAEKTQFQALFSWMLTTPSIHSLADLEGAGKNFPQIQKKYQSRFAEISQTIRGRNAALLKAGKMPYEYLDPTMVAASIDI